MNTALTAQDHAKAMTDYVAQGVAQLKRSGQSRPLTLGKDGLTPTFSKHLIAQVYVLKMQWIQQKSSCCAPIGFPVGSSPGG